MNVADFKNQLINLYGNDYSLKNKLEQECFAKKGFLELSNYFMENEIIEAIAPIADNPQGWNRTKSSFLQNWYLILTNKRMVFASPSLILKEPTATSYKYSVITSVAASKWNSIKITAQGYIGFMSITGRYFYYEQRDELIRIIEKHMYE